MFLFVSVDFKPYRVRWAPEQLQLHQPTKNYPNSMEKKLSRAIYFIVRSSAQFLLCCYARPKYLTKINLNLIIYIVCWLAPASVRWKKVETDRPIALQVYNSQILPSSNFWIEKLELLRLSLVWSALSCRLNPSFSTPTRPECLLIDFMKLSSNSRQRITIKLI